MHPTHAPLPSLQAGSKRCADAPRPHCSLAVSLASRRPSGRTLRCNRYDSRAARCGTARRPSLSSTGVKQNPSAVRLFHSLGRRRRRSSPRACAAIHRSPTSPSTITPHSTRAPPRWCAAGPAHGALPHCAPSARRAADLVHRVWHRCAPCPPRRSAISPSPSPELPTTRAKR